MIDSLLQELEVGEGEFVLSGTYPRKELTEDMDRETLSQLGLAPSGVVVVRFRRVSVCVCVCVCV